MKLLRFGPVGNERPGILDHHNQIRDLSGVVDDISHTTLLPDSIKRLQELDLDRLLLVTDQPQDRGLCRKRR